jgi:hypothetical protein
MTSPLAWNSRRARSSRPGWCGKPNSRRKKSGPAGPWPSGFQKKSSGQSSDWTPSWPGPPESGTTSPPSRRARNVCSSFHWALSMASPVVTASAGGAPVAGPCRALTVRSVASTACTVSASCGRCTGMMSAYLGSAKCRLRNSNRVGDWTSASWRSVRWTRHSSGLPAAPGLPAPASAWKSSRTTCCSPSMRVTSR